MVIAVASGTIRVYYVREINREILSTRRRQNDRRFKIMANQENKQTTNTGTETQSSSRPTGALSSVKFDTSKGSGAEGATGAATATAKSFYDQAKETAGQAYEAVTDKAATKLDEQKSTLSGGLATVADSVRQVSGNLESSKADSGLAEAAAKYTNTAAEKLENVAGYFDSKSVREMASDLETFARRNPVVFLGAAFGLGLLAARFLKSTPSGNYRTGAGREFASAAGADGKANVPQSSGSSDRNTPSAPRSMAKPL